MKTKFTEPVIMYSNIAIIILAAGSSSRLGQPKQLLTYQSQSLLQHIVSLVSILPSVTPAVVIGANREIIEANLLSADIKIIINDEWQQGMASSIKAGLRAMLETNPSLDGCLFAVCDQPYISTALLNEIIAVHAQTGKGIIAAAYADTLGTPVFFSKKYFDNLLALNNDEGAKKIIRQYAADVASVPFPNGEVDIDTLEDYHRLLNAEPIN